MEDLFGNILGAEEMETLFTEPEDTSAGEVEDKEELQEEQTDESQQKKKDTAEVVDPETLFEDEEPESVGSEEKKESQGKEDTDSDKTDGTSPNENFYSSIANALKEEGIFPDLDEKTVNETETAEDFRDLIKAQIDAGLNDVYRRVNDALTNGVEPSDIKKYENTLNYLASLQESNLTAETDEGEKLRFNLIYQDFINKGYTPEKAQKFTQRTVEAGTDIEDAKEALQSNQEFFQREYSKLLDAAKYEAEKAKEERRVQAEKLKDSILKDKQLMGDIPVDDATRKKVFENISKPVWRDPETGDYYTAIQKYELEHRSDFLKYVSLIYTVTNGFKDFDSFTKGKVKKEVSKGLRDLEQKLNNTRRDAGGNLKLVTGVKEDPESFIGKGWKLDV